MSPGNIVHGWVGLDITLKVDVFSPVYVVHHQISPESNSGSGSDCNVNI